MNRVWAILIPIILVGLIPVHHFVTEIMITQYPPKLEDVMRTAMIVAGSEAFIIVCLVCYCGFAALHAMQYLNSPKDRTIWLIATLGANLLGSCVYYLTVYQTFRKEGKGRLMSFKRES